MAKKTRVREVTDPDYGLPTKGDPLINVMQLDDLNKKVDLILESLKRIETRQASGLEAIKEGPTQGSFGSSELPPDTKD